MDRHAASAYALHVRNEAGDRDPAKAEALYRSDAGLSLDALAWLWPVVDDATIPELPNHYRGKVRDNYDLPDGRRLIIATDRLSAFDRNIAAIPFKGQVLTQIARFWFDRTADLCRRGSVRARGTTLVLRPCDGGEDNHCRECCDHFPSHACSSAH